MKPRIHNSINLLSYNKRKGLNPLHICHSLLKLHANGFDGDRADYLEKQENYGHKAKQQLTTKKIFITQLVANDKYAKEAIA
ncbi:MAG: hypothetical protein JW815_00675 [Candidatus Bathyarchaeota archaeon]|nr:hypothetical protein [Candidatus Bathyarchaeum sp.]